MKALLHNHPSENGAGFKGEHFGLLVPANDWATERRSPETQNDQVRDR